MHPCPRTYLASASAKSTGPVVVSSPQLPTLEVTALAPFEGPAGVWSPETLLCASIADWFILTFRAVARSARFEWLRLECRVEGVLERVGLVSQFTRYTTFAMLTVPFGTDAAKAHELLELAEHGCLIGNSLRGERDLYTHVVTADPANRAEREAAPGLDQIKIQTTAAVPTLRGQ